MRELTVCLVVACLASLASANTRNYEYPGKDLIRPDQALPNDELAYGVCEPGGKPAKKCTLYRVAAGPDGERSCELPLNYTNESFASNFDLRSVGKGRVILAARRGDAAYSLVTVGMTGCRVKEVAVDTDANSTLTVVPNDSNFDVIYENREHCGEYVCRAVYDYDGNVVSEASAFGGLKATKSSLVVKNAGDGNYLVGEYISYYSPIKVYLVRTGAKDAKLLYSTAEGLRGELYVSSTAARKLSFCALIERRLVCRQYDADGEAKLEVEKPISIGTYDAIDVLNLEGAGLLVLWIEQPFRSDGQGAAVIFRYDERGRPAKSAYADLNCREGGYSVPRLYRSAGGEYCVHAVCRRYLGTGDSDYKFSVTTKCFAKSELE